MWTNQERYVRMAWNSCGQILRICYIRIKNVLQIEILCYTYEECDEIIIYVDYR